MTFKTPIVLLSLFFMALFSVGLASEWNTHFKAETCDLDANILSVVERCNRGENEVCPYVAIAVLDHECPLAMSVNLLDKSCERGSAFSCYTAAEMFSGGYDNFIFSDSLRGYYIGKACSQNNAYCADARDIALKKELRCARFELHKRFNVDLYHGRSDVERYFHGACLNASQESPVSYKELAAIYDKGYLSAKEKRTNYILQEAKMLAGTIKEKDSKCRRNFLENTCVASVLFSRARIELGIEYLKKAKPCNDNYSMWSWGGHAPENVLIPDSIKLKMPFWRAP